jgi:hypothetical protein
VHSSLQAGRRAVQAVGCRRRGLLSPWWPAPQVAARREQRVLLAEAQAAAPTVIAQREPEEILIGALHDVNATLQAIKAELSELSAGSVNPAVLPLVGDWLDRVARIADRG